MIEWLIETTRGWPSGWGFIAGFAIGGIVLMIVKLVRDK